MKFTVKMRGKWCETHLRAKQMQNSAREKYKITENEKSLWCNRQAGQWSNWRRIVCPRLWQKLWAKKKISKAFPEISCVAGSNYVPILSAAMDIFFKIGHWTWIPTFERVRSPASLSSEAGNLSRQDCLRRQRAASSVWQNHPLSVVCVTSCSCSCSLKRVSVFLLNI